MKIQTTFSPPAGNGSATAGTAIPCNTLTHTVTAGAATAGAVIGVLLGLLLIGKGI